MQSKFAIVRIWSLLRDLLGVVDLEMLVDDTSCYVHKALVTIICICGSIADV